jgi:hypothetical protein
MFSVRLHVMVSLTVVIFLLCPWASWGQTSRVQNPGTGAPPDAELAALAEVPSGQVMVTYENNELTIKSQSAPLIEVLRAVCGQIGADLDGPSEADETVLGVIGPGPAREVLAAMLTGSPYDLATSGTAEAPDAVAHVVVFQKTKESADQKTKGSADTSSATAEAKTAAVTQPLVDSTADVDDVVVKPDMQQVLELLGEVKSEIIVDGDGNSRDMASALQTVEAQIKAAATESQGGSAQPGVSQTGTAGLAGRPIIRHGRR